MKFLEKCRIYYTDFSNNVMDMTSKVQLKNQNVISAAILNQDTLHSKGSNQKVVKGENICK